MENQDQPKSEQQQPNYKFHHVLVNITHAVPPHALEPGDLMHSISILFLGDGDDGMGLGGSLETPYHETVEAAYSKVVSGCCGLRVWDALLVDEAQSEVDQKPEMLADIVKRAIARDKELFACPT